MNEERYCHALAFRVKKEDFENSYCLYKKIQKREDRDCIAVERQSELAGTGEFEYNFRKAKHCPLNIGDEIMPKRVFILQSFKKIFS